MLNLKIGNREFQVKFGYEATLKSRLISRMAKMNASAQGAESNFEKVEDMLLFIPDALLVGLQKFHSDEFGYNYSTGEDYEKQKEKVFALVAEHIDDDGVDCVDFFNQLQDEMLQNGFLSKMFQNEVEKEMKEQHAEKKES